MGLCSEDRVKGLREHKIIMKIIGDDADIEGNNIAGLPSITRFMLRHGPEWD